ncbi:hypothetical protein BGZ96_004111 [Linnemannia gamsii]|uniref:Yeast cell wall synthesis Kre9/Knh1-like N-terminal domain-containing protein n=1 Tax=Linnemannia gamsii TaxID=64522 RepID=A0ABQ7JIF9_9FUNG|nr:hypothetical protein BGZ96_004111 [Linnemannia gamsii]
MKSTILLAIAASMVAVASAEPLKYGAPIASTTWTAGQDATISWINTCVGTTTSFPVMLQIQRADGVQIPVPGLASLGDLDCAKAGSLTVKVPTTVASGTQYSILVANAPDQSYSALFTIKNAAMPDPAANATTTAATVAPTASTTAGASSSVTGKPSVTVTTASSTPSSTTKPNNAGALKTGSAAALAVAGAVAALIF